MELLVAMGVTILLVALLLKVFTATSNTWQHGEAQVDAYREARAALQIMARDLSATLQASYAPTTSTSAAAVGPLLPTLVLQRYGEATTAAASAGPQNEEVYCLTNISNPGASSLCAVGYYCQWMPDQVTGAAQARAPRAYALMRQFLDSNGTFRRIKAKAVPAASPAPSATPVPMPLGFMDLYARAGTPPVAKSDPLAAYIWDLRFRIDTDLNEHDVPDGNAVGAPKDHSTPTQRFYDGDANTPYPPALPAYVEIRFKALSTTAGRRLENQNVKQSDWEDVDPQTHKAKDLFQLSTVYKSVILPNAQQFVLRVPLAYTTPTSATISSSPTP